MNGQMDDRCTKRQSNQWTDRQTKEQTDGWIDRQMDRDRRMDGQTDSRQTNGGGMSNGLTNGRMDRQTD